MAKANIKIRDGTEIRVEGTPEEIAKIMDLYGDKDMGTRDKDIKISLDTKNISKKKVDTKPTITDKIREMIAEGYFKKPIGLAELKMKLEEEGYFVPMSTLSGMVLGLTKNKELRRLKQEGRWSYVGK